MTRLILTLLCVISFVPARAEQPLPAVHSAAMEAPSGPNITAGKTTPPLRGVYELSLISKHPIADPYLDPPKVTFTRPDATCVTVDAFYDGVVSGKPVFKARAYCDHPGVWSWTTCATRPNLHGNTGTFAVTPSELPGKLRKHPDDPHQFAYENGGWYLHIGDTGYRYVVDTEPEWQAYIDQAARMGATKIRTWFCRSRSGVEALFTPDRSALNLPYWQEIDRRVQYALNRHPQLILQLIPYGEDRQELLRFARGDRMSRFVAQYAQARLSAFPNILWCVSNDQKIAANGENKGDEWVPAAVIDSIAREMAAREPWGTLLTNHQARRTRYAFTDARWSDIVTLEDLDQVGGELLLEYRDKTDDPVINDEDRYELHETPAHPRYYFRRLMWASLLSGGGATYGGARTYEPYDGRERGVRGYYDLNREGVLRGGGDDFTHIHAFFKKAGLTLVGMRPEDALAGGNPRAIKVTAGGRAVIAYVANPDSDLPGQADAAGNAAEIRLHLPPGSWSLRWFNPQTGDWFDAPPFQTADGDSPWAGRAPFAGDAVLLATRTVP